MMGVKELPWLQGVYLKFTTVIRWLLWSNILLAGSAAGWVIITLKTLNLPFDWALIMLAFCLAVAFYTRDRLDEKERQADLRTMPERTIWVEGHLTRLKGIVWGAFLGAMLLLTKRPTALLPLLSGLGFALSYTLRWFPWRGRRWGWKHMPGMKMPFVAILWTLTTVMTPAVVYDQVRLPEAWFLAGAVCLLIMGQILLNDLRDVEGDFLSGTHSLPVLCGEATARQIGYGLILFAVLMMYAIDWFLFTLLGIYTLFLIRFYNRQQDNLWRPWIEAQGLVAALIAFFC